MAKTRPLELKPSQKKLIKTALSGDYLEILYAGSAGTGKSFATAFFLVGVCHDFPNSRIGVFRKNRSTAKKTIWQTYKKVLSILKIPYETNESDLIISFPGTGSCIEFFELDRSKDQDWNKVKSLELTCAHMEEANEMDVSGKNILLTRIGRWNENGFPKMIIMTCNPADGWVRTEFRDKHIDGSIKANKTFIEVGIEEMPDEYVEQLKNLPEAEYSRFVENNWDYSEDPNQLIQFAWIKDSYIAENKSEADFLAMDVARTGADRTVLGYRNGMDFTGFNIVDTDDTTVSASFLKNKLDDLRLESFNACVDVIGVGGGVVDMVPGVLPFNSSGKPTRDAGHLQFKNQRAQIYWTLRENIRNGDN